MNYSDSARIKAILLNCWFSYTPNVSEADIIIFDTCSVKQKAEDKITGKLKEIWKHQKIWITWCMIQHNLRNSKIDKWAKLKVWNFMWSLQTKTPQIIWFTTDEINIPIKGPNITLLRGTKGVCFFNLRNLTNKTIKKVKFKIIKYGKKLILNSEI